jgi:hypothetical protein
MRRVAADRTMGLLVLAIAPSFAVADDGPASSAPAPAPRLEGPGVSAAESQGSTAELRPVPARTVPRLLAPRSPRPRIAAAPAPAVSPAAEAPPLRPLVEVGTPAGDLPQALTIPDAPPLEGPAPLTLETVPDESALAPPLDSLEPLPPARPSSARDRDREDEDEDEDDEIDESIPSPPRRRGLLGRLRPSPPPPPPTRVESRRGDDPLGTRSDPAAEAALKRRVEAQVRVALGRHLRSVDVRVVDREVRIRARIDHFWNRRAARRDLESLPALAGLRSQIEVE